MAKYRIAIAASVCITMEAPSEQEARRLANEYALRNTEGCPVGDGERESDARVYLRTLDEQPDAITVEDIET
ncbi:MAG: hypothetical protein M5U26_12565 [Planctomycetota bacterium]|nr:hypothetical protein [Planctomycetota bacterium]